jgi:tetratricopeptide (TPR) repeat protein
MFKKMTILIFGILLLFLLPGECWSSILFDGVNLTPTQRKVVSFEKKADDFFENKAYKKALDSYTFAIDLSPKIDTLYFKRGLCAYQLKDYKSAKYNFETAILLDKENAKYWYVLGNTFYWQRQVKKSIEAYTKSIAIAPHTDALLNRGLLYEAMYETDKAKKDYEEALRLDPKSGAQKYINRVMEQ